jgi:hypothetical protein
MLEHFDKQNGLGYILGGFFYKPIWSPGLPDFLEQNTKTGKNVHKI